MTLILKHNEQSRETARTIQYDHAIGPPSVDGARAALSAIFGSKMPESLLDIGCGTGAWMRAAIDLGVCNVLGIDGIQVAQELLHVDRAKIECLDLSKSFDLGRRFDVAVCLEVAEHLPEISSDDFISSIVNHADSILFSAACPDQVGQHHINCQWPIYWQNRFNSHSFACDDSIRWQIWNDIRIDPWYRQNIFWARRDPENAGREPRLKAVVHPEIHDRHLRYYVERGKMPAMWYVATPPQALIAKLLRWIDRHRGRQQ